jgi:hypothetical protein
MRKILIVLMAALLFCAHKTLAQGCVAIRSTGATCALHTPDSLMNLNGWQLGINYRYYKSYKHFVGKVEQKARVDTGSNVINYSNTIDIVVNHELNKRWSIAVDAPIIANTR